MPTRPDVHADVRRHAAFLSQGAGRFLVIIQMAMGSLDGALTDRQWGVAAIQARLVVWECMAIRSIPRGGEITWARDSASFDPFRHAPPEELEVVDRLLRSTAQVLAGAAPEVVAAWRADLGDFVQATEDLLEVEGGLPILRSADGMYRALGMARGVFETIESLSLPSPLPAQWAEPGADDEQTRWG